MSDRLTAMWQIDERCQQAKKNTGPDSPETRALEAKRAEAYESLTLAEQLRYMFIGR
jgi:hypothetical protein